MCVRPQPHLCYLSSSSKIKTYTIINAHKLQVTKRNHDKNVCTLTTESPKSKIHWSFVIWAQNTQFTSMNPSDAFEFETWKRNTSWYSVSVSNAWFTIPRYQLEYIMETAGTKSKTWFTALWHLLKSARKAQGRKSKTWFTTARSHDLPRNIWEKHK